VLLKIHSVGARWLKPRRRDEIRNLHAVDLVSEFIGFDCIANFERVDFAVAAHRAPVDPGIGQHFEQFVA
jgi:hypothetical protein